MVLRTWLVQRWICVGLFFAVIGCGSGGKKQQPTVPVFGMLVVDGKPAEQTVSIACWPTKDIPNPQAGYPAVAAGVSAEGKFELNMFSNKKGIPEGEYALTFTWLKTPEAPSSIDAELDSFEQRYDTIAKSPKKFTVAAGKELDLGTIELKAGKK